MNISKSSNHPLHSSAPPSRLATSSIFSKFNLTRSHSNTMSLYSRIRNTLIHAVQRFAEFQVLSYVNTRRYDVVFTSLLGLSVLGGARVCFLRPIASSNMFAEPHALRYSESHGTTSHQQKASLVLPSHTVIIKRLIEPVNVYRLLIHAADIAISASMWLIVNEHQYGGRIEAQGDLPPETANRERLSFFAELLGCAVAKCSLTAIQLYLNGRTFKEELKQGHFSGAEERKLHSSRIWRVIMTTLPSAVALIGVVSLYEPGATTAAVANKPFVPVKVE